MTTKKNTPLYYLPLGQTVYQKSLVDILIKLHKPHILSYLEKENYSKLENKTNQSSKEQQKNCDKMSDESMLDAFIFNIKQITNHPTLLVDHYIPRNLLLLNSRENIINLSNKYHQISEILDKLVERDVGKTIIISVSNAKEMDLIESFLLGKRGLQYYRFSGSSLFYDNHGSFNFHKDDELTTKNNTNTSSSSSPTPPDLHITEQQPVIKKRGRGPGKKNNSTISDDHNSLNNTNTYGEKRKKKKTGRPSTAEKRAREQQAQLSASVAAATSSNQSNGKIRTNREEYTPKLSKNNEEFIKILEEKRGKKLNVYLILSSQLKYLLQFEDLKSDLILSLDSNFTNFEELSNILNHQVPILKPMILESLEHYEWELNASNDIIYNDDFKRSKNLRRSRASNTNHNRNDINSITNGNSTKDRTPEEKVKFNSLLALLSIAALNKVEVELPSTLQPVPDSLIDWLVDPEKYSYPFSQRIPTQLPHVMDGLLVKEVKQTLDMPYEPSSTIGINKLDKYSYFDSKLQEKTNAVKENDLTTLNNGNGFEGTPKLESPVKVKIENDTKRIKPNPDQLTISSPVPDTFTYREYQSHLTNLINNTYQEILQWMNKTKKQLEFVHLDETERQFVIDQGNFECGELFKKDRDLGVKIEARGKVKEKHISEYEKLVQLVSVDSDIESKKGLKERYEIYNSYDDDSILDNDKQKAEIESLNKKLEELKLHLNDAEKKSFSVRQRYQEVSSNAAELSAVVKNLETEGKKLEEESKGIFKKIQLESINEQQKYVDEKSKELENDCRVWKGYLTVLQTELEKRTSNVNGGNNSRFSRTGRNNTPH